MKNITFIGLGSMGLPMAINLLGAGYEVKGYDLSPVAIQKFAQAGGQACSSVSDACQGSELAILMVVNAQQARDVLFAQGGLDVLSENAIICLMATCSPGDVEKLSTDVQSAGRHLVDCPVSGGVVGAQAGSLTLMAACENQLFQRLTDVFQVIGQRIYHVGKTPGQGAMCKTINQLLCGLHIAVAAEAFSLAKKAQLDVGLLLDIMSGSSASSWMLKDRGPRMLQAQPEVTSAVDIFVKDLGIVSQAGKELQAALPLTSVALQMFTATAGRGFGKADDSQVIQSFDVLNGV